MTQLQSRFISLTDQPVSGNNTMENLSSRSGDNLSLATFASGVSRRERSDSRCRRNYGDGNGIKLQEMEQVLKIA